MSISAEAQSSDHDNRAELEPQGAGGYHLHDGFFMRGAIFGGYLRDKFEAEGDSFFRIRSGTTRGAAFGLELAVGGAIAPGWILAGGLVASWGVGSTVDLVVDDPAHEVELGAQSMGALVAITNVYPDPRGGLYFEAGGGPARFAVSQTERQGDWNTAQGSTGWSVLAGVGYDVWTGPQNSVGLQVRGVFGRFDGPDAHPPTNSSGTREHRVLMAPVLMGTVTYN